MSNYNDQSSLNLIFYKTNGEPIKFNIEEYLNSLPEDTIEINVSQVGLTYLPDLSKFKNLKILRCPYNSLTSLPKLNKNLLFLDCSHNKLTSLPELNEDLQNCLCNHNELLSLPKLNHNLKVLLCSSNRLISLPKLNENLEWLDCTDNKITELPKLNINLVYLYCGINKLTILPELHHDLWVIQCYENRLPKIFITKDHIITNEEKIIINRFIKCRYRIMCFKYRNNFRKWLWEKIRLPKIQQYYHPEKLQEILATIEDENDEEEFFETLNNW